MSRNYLKFLLGLFFLSVFYSQNVLAADGKAIFKANCAVCHSMCDQKLTGPGLKGVADRAPKGDWLFKWIKNNNKLISAGDDYATKLVKENGGSDLMNEFEFLSDEEVNALVDYLKKGDCVVKVAEKKDEVNPNEPQEGGIDPLYIVLAVVVVLLILISILRGVRHSLQTVVDAKSGIAEKESLTFWEETKNWVSNNRRLMLVIIIVLVLLGMRSCWNACMKIGVYYDKETNVGYKPEQPIKFSHKLHAGENKIACQYCHNTVEKSRHSGIPTVNVCMNCHKAIQSGPKYQEKEIAKIYAAAGFDPKTQQYDASKANPIKWIKVHNLPDHVYFNHSQHVVVGKQECQTCHGQVQEMDVVEQRSPLTMAWCIECHRKTEVAMEGNAYYDKMHAFLKEKYKKENLKKFTVAQMGGLECGKCHY